MKITEKYLKQVIQKEYKNILKENSRKEELLQAFIDIYQADKRSDNQSHRRFKVVDGPSRSEVLSDVLTKFNMNIYELFDALETFEGKIDQNMFAELHDTLNKIIMYSDMEQDRSEFRSYEDPEPQNPDYGLRKKHLKIVKQ